MKRLMGGNVDVVFKDSSDTISGILFDIDEECIYIQNGVNIFITVPKENIKYYVSNSFQNTSLIKERIVSEHKKEAEDLTNRLLVHVDNDLVAKIPVPPTFNLATFTDDTMKVVLGNPDVKASLQGRIQTSMEYYPGEVFIMTSIDAIDDNAQNTSNAQTSFSMSGTNSSVANSYLNPSQMVSRLNNVARNKKESIDE